MKVFKKRMLPVLSAATVIILLFIVLTASAFAATETIEISASAGDEDYVFSHMLHVVEASPFAGIQFELSFSGDGVLTFDSYTISGSDVAAAFSVAPVYRDGVYMFGFTTGSNAFSGELDVGEISFTYSGVEAASITVTSARFLYFPDDGNTSDWLREELELVTINITRPSGVLTPNGDMGLMITDQNLPLFSGVQDGYGWALLNLLLCLSGIVMAIVAAMRIAELKKRSAGGFSVTPDIELSKESDKGLSDVPDKVYKNKEQSRRVHVLILLTIALAVAGLVLFLLTQDMFKLMALTDSWSIALALVFIAELIAFIFLQRANRVNILVK